MTAATRTSGPGQIFRPRLIYYNDAHHFHGKRVEPPVSIAKLRQPVDEVLGTSVDLLVLGLGYGRRLLPRQQGWARHRRG